MSTPNPGSPTVEDFLRGLYASNKNRVEGRAAACELFGKDSPFRIVCTKCGSQEVTIIGELGCDYGGETGYCAGSTVIKCHGCGAAMSAWQ
jgi:hypothetical protein